MYFLSVKAVFVLEVVVAILHAANAPASDTSTGTPAHNKNNHSNTILLLLTALETRIADIITIKILLLFQQRRV